MVAESVPPAAETAPPRAGCHVIVSADDDVGYAKNSAAKRNVGFDIREESTNQCCSWVGLRFWRAVRRLTHNLPKDTYVAVFQSLCVLNIADQIIFAPVDVTQLSRARLGF